MFFSAVPCSVHRLPTHTTATLHLPCWRWRYPHGGWWTGRYKQIVIVFNFHVIWCLLIFEIASDEDKSAISMVNLKHFFSWPVFPCVTFAGISRTRIIEQKNVFQGEFREENFNTAMAVLKDSGDGGKGEDKGPFKPQRAKKGTYVLC